MDRDYRRACALTLGVALGLSGCASTGPAPIEDRSLNPPSHPRDTSAPARAAPQTAGTYRVQRGDTLYSIAFRHGVDYRELAAWNGIEPPYTIYPGRELRLSPGHNATKRAIVEAAPPALHAVPAAPPPTAGVARPPSKTPAPGPFEPVAAAPAPTAQSSSTTTSVAAAPAPPPHAAQPPAATNAPIASAADVPLTSSGDITWRWPADGQVIGGYVGGDPMRQGVDIAGQSGAPVRAAADGTVVYSGNGLIGYGELIIVKHNPAFLSAYGHNRKRLVQEGDHVKGGQTIAEMGSSGATRDELHFEIRRNGKPSNPLDYLPHR